MSEMFDRLRRAATPAATGAALLAFAAILVLMEIVDAGLAEIAPGVPKPDLVFGYDAQLIGDTYAAWGSEGRAIYFVSTLIDTLMPVLAAAATVLVAARLTRRWLPLLAIGPVLFMVADIIENALFLVLLGSYPDLPAPVVAVASPLTQLKLIAFWAVTVPTLALSLLLLIGRWLAATLRRRPSPA